MIQVKRMAKTTDKKTSETVRKVQELKKIKREKSYKDDINSIFWNKLQKNSFKGSDR